MKIGNRIRRLRKLRGLTIEDLADKAELTKGFISQLERDLTVPTITTLKQVLDVLGVDLSAFFSDLSEREKNIFITKDRTIEKKEEFYTIQSLIPKLKYLEMEPLLLSLNPLAEYNSRFADDEGFGYVVRGILEVSIEQEKKRLNKGDCFYIFFDNELHVKNISKKNAEILLVNY